MQGIAKTPELGEMLDKIRANHIDIVPIILEELKYILPQYIEEIVSSTYVKVMGE